MLSKQHAPSSTITLNIAINSNKISTVNICYVCHNVLEIGKVCTAVLNHPAGLYTCHVVQRHATGLEEQHCTSCAQSQLHLEEHAIRMLGPVCI